MYKSEPDSKENLKATLEKQVYENKKYREEMWQRMLYWRNIITPCKKCGGSGVITYPSTALWRSGIGGQMISHGVCNECWGSGDENEHWSNIRKMENYINSLEVELKILADKIEKGDKKCLKNQNSQ